jgi:hypothetical protein
MNFLSSINDFVFIEDFELKSEKPDPHSLSFVLTDTKGKKYFAQSLIFYESLVSYLQLLS